MIENFSVLGKSISLYYSFWILSLVIALIVGCALGKLYGFSYARSIILVSLDILLAYLLIWAISWIFGGGKTIGFNFARILIFAPIYFVLLAFVFKVPLWKLADFFSPVGAIVAGVSHLGCIFSGCCHGYPSAWGIYSNVAGTVCFPIQPIESITNISIGILLLFMAKRGIQKKRLYIWFMILFGATRFIWEFFRDNDKIWLGLSDLALHALASAVVGLAALFIIKWCAHKEVTHHEKNKV